MKAYNTYKSVVFSITTALVFICWKIIEGFNTSNIFFTLIIGALVSLGAYRFVLGVFEKFLQKSKKIKELVFGNSYLEGIWVGCYRNTDAEPILYIECFEQDFNGLVIHGRCYTWEKVYRGTWVSEKVVIDEEKGTMSYTYETDMVYNNHKNQGFAVLSFYRRNKTLKPYKLIGFSSDIYTPTKFLTIEKKVEYSQGHFEDAELLELAREFYLLNETLF